jgi:hypothetical protein
MSNDDQRDAAILNAAAIIFANLCNGEALPKKEALAARKFAATQAHMLRATLEEVERELAAKKD